MSNLELELDLGTIGRVRVRGNTPQEVIEGATFWQALPTQCPICQAELQIVHQRVVSKREETRGDSFDYYRLVCLGTPRHSNTLGQYKEKNGGGLYLKANAPWEAYDPRGRDEDAGEFNPNETAPQQQRSSQARVDSPPTGDMVTRDEADAFFKEMVGHKIRPQDVRVVAEKILKRPFKGLTDLTRAELRTVKEAALQSTPRREPPKGLEGGPINESEQTRFDDL